MGEAHRFRFFVSSQHSIGDVVPLSHDDAAHVRVLRLGAGDHIEIIDAAGMMFAAELCADRTSVRLQQVLDARRGEAQREIVLVAAALVGGRFDQLVDNAIQAGATRIVPLALSASEHERLSQRGERLRRIAKAAAKQSKRPQIPAVESPITRLELLSMSAGVLLDAAGDRSLPELIREIDGDIRILIGPSDGLASDLIEQLVQRGWEVARLGPSILRSELAAAVAVAIAAIAPGH